MYIPFSYFGGDSCVYYAVLNQDIFENDYFFNYTDCNNITQSVLVENFTAKYFSVNPTQPFDIGGFGSRINNSGITSPINNLSLKTEYYEIITHNRPTGNVGDILQSNLYVPYFSSSISFDYFSSNTVGNVLGRTSNTYITSYPQFYSGYNNYHTIIPLQDTSSLTTTIEYLIVAGGGGGGNDTGTGGGGAGGFLSGSLIISSSVNSSLVYVGNGGAAATNGQNSTLLGLTAIGGGAGNQPFNTTGSNGGSGGGSGTLTASIGTSGQGFGGGTGLNREAGGGGGASQAGYNGQSGLGGDGGSGSQWLDGIWYAGGGGGGTDNSSANGAPGGIGGGGNGGSYTSFTSSAGQPNTGGGGGGGGLTLTNGGSAGGSGIVKLRYIGPRIAVGGDETYYENGYTYHVYTQSGVSSSFEFMGGSYPIRDYSTIPTSSLSVTQSLVSLIDTIYTESFDKFNYNIAYDVTPNLNNLFVDYSNTYSYVTSSVIPYIQFDDFSSEDKKGLLCLNSISSTSPIEELTLVAVYNVSSFNKTVSDPSSNRFINIFGDSRAQRASKSYYSQFDPFGMWLSGSADNLNSLVIQHHNDDIILPFSSSIDGWHISQMSYNKSTNTITWANDNITGSSSISTDDWYRITPGVGTNENIALPYGFATGSKFRMFAVYTSSLSADELLENYNFISQSLI